MTYEEYVDKYDFSNEDEMTNEQYLDFISKIEERIKSYLPINSYAIQTIYDYYDDYHDREIEETGRHGWVTEVFVFKIGNEYYSFYGWTHDDYGWDIDEQVLEPVEQRPVTIMKWFNKREST